MKKFSFSERDLDLIQLEELHSENGYSIWFTSRIGLEQFSFVSAYHSVSATVNGTNGETDVLAFFERPGCKMAVLIEHKISADFTQRQAERYIERGADLVRSGDVNEFRTVLVAPRNYLSSVPETTPWDAKIEIEEIAFWFEAQTGHHYRWRSNALQTLIKKLNRNQSPATEDAARFSRAFSEYLKAMYAPELTHNPGKDKNGPIIKFPGSSKNKTLWWKVSTNQMVMQLMGEYVGKSENLDLPYGIELERASEHKRKCDHLVAPVPPVDFSETFEAQIASVEDAIDMARRLVSLVPRLDAAVERKNAQVS